MMIGSEAIRRLSEQTISFRAKLVPWADRYQEDAAHVISAAYRGHVDSEINDQYRTIPGARRFLTNIVKYPGCGRFSPAASVVAVDEGSGRVCGVCLASLVSANSGHVTQTGPCRESAVRDWATNFFGDVYSRSSTRAAPWLA